MDRWHQDDRFWEAFGPAMFSARRWDGTPAEVDGVLALAPVEAGAAVLDLCCGPGRVSLEFARRGFRVTGVDRTEAYLAEARRRAAADDLEVELIAGDMRAFTRPATFALAVNLYTSFGYFEDPADDLAVARNLHESLAPGGRLVMEMLGKEVLARVFRVRDWTWVDQERGVLLLEERRLRSGWDWIDNDWTLLRPTETIRRRLSHRLYSGSELRALLERAGFGRVDLFGTLTGAPYDHEAKRLVAVAQR